MIFLRLLLRLTLIDCTHPTPVVLDLSGSSALLCLCLLFTAAAAAAHCSCPQPNSLAPVGSRFLSTAVHFLSPDLLDLADSHTCPQSSNGHSLTHLLTYRPSSPLLHVDYHYLLPRRSACDLQRCVRSHYFAATVATYRAAYCQLFSVPPSISAVVPSDPSVLHSLP